MKSTGGLLGDPHPQIFTSPPRIDVVARPRSIHIGHPRRIAKPLVLLSFSPASQSTSASGSGLARPFWCPHTVLFHARYRAQIAWRPEGEN